MTAIAITDKNAAVFDATVTLVAEVGMASLEVSQLLKVGRGAVIELDKLVEGDILLKIENRLFATGSLENYGDAFAIKISQIIP